jgi:hypothetical protein
MLAFISPFLRTAIMATMIAVRKNGEINTNMDTSDELHITLHAHKGQNLT